MASRKSAPPSAWRATDFEALRALDGKSEEEVRALLGKPRLVGGAKLVGATAVWKYPDAYQEPGADHCVPIFVYIDNNGKVSRASKFSPEQLGRFEERKRRAAEEMDRSSQILARFKPHPFPLHYSDLPYVLVDDTGAAASSHAVPRTPPAHKPYWDGKKTLEYKGKVWLDYEKKAPTTAKVILDLLQEADWPINQDVPVPQHLLARKDGAKELRAEPRLRGIINRLNIKLDGSTVRLQSVKGKYVRVTYT